MNVSASSYLCKGATAVYRVVTEAEMAYFLKLRIGSLTKKCSFFRKCADGRISVKFSYENKDICHNFVGNLFLLLLLECLYNLLLTHR
jgi:hypothetical protein